MINSVIACLFLFVFGAVLFVVNATAPFLHLNSKAERAEQRPGLRSALHIIIPRSSSILFISSRAGLFPSCWAGPLLPALFLPCQAGLLVPGLFLPYQAGLLLSGLFPPCRAGLLVPGLFLPYRAGPSCPASFCIAGPAPLARPLSALPGRPPLARPLSALSGRSPLARPLSALPGRSPLARPISALSGRSPVPGLFPPCRAGLFLPYQASLLLPGPFLPCRAGTRTLCGDCRIACALEDFPHELLRKSPGRRGAGCSR